MYHIQVCSSKILQPSCNLGRPRTTFEDNDCIQIRSSSTASSYETKRTNLNNYRGIFFLDMFHHQPNFVRHFLFSHKSSAESCSLVNQVERSSLHEPPESSSIIDRVKHASLDKSTESSMAVDQIE